MTARRVLAALAVLVAATSPGTGKAETIELVTGENYAPYTGSDLPEGGFASAVIRLAFERAGIDARIGFDAWSRALDRTRDRAVFGTFPWIDTPERREFLAFSEPVIVLEQHGLYSPERPLRASGLADLTGKVLCNPFSYAKPASLADPIAAGAIPVEEPDLELSCYRMLLRGRVDFYVIQKQMAEAFLADTEMTMSAFAFTDFPIVVQRLGLAAAKDHPDAPRLLAAFNGALAAMRADGTYARLAAKHGVTQ